MSKFLTASVALAALATAAPASAADLLTKMYSKVPIAVATATNWIGCYFGVNGGYARVKTMFRAVAPMKDPRNSMAALAADRLAATTNSRHLGSLASKACMILPA